MTSKKEITEIAGNIPGISNLTYLTQGGQKHVLKGTHAKYGEIALKIIPVPNERVKREILIAKENKFINVPSLYDWGPILVDGCGGIFIIEQFVAGQNLRDLLAVNKVLSLAMCVQLAFDLLETIVQLEEKHLVHRDIKPENIIFDGEKFWLLDFGIARNLDLVSITATEQHFGPHSVGYAAPEQFRNIKAQIDSRADLFSLGVVLYEALTGNHPFLRDAVSPLDALKRTESVQPAQFRIDGDTDSSFAQYVNILLSKYPSRRPVNARFALQWLLKMIPKLKGG